MTISQSKNFYQVLNCDQSASFEELKNNYQKLVKQYHPDKCSGQEDSSDELFKEIDSAWKVLRDPDARKQYDAMLLQEDLEQTPLIYADVDKDEVEFDSDGVGRFPCRCGNLFIINKTDLFDGIAIVECTECTNCIKIS